MTGEEQGRAEQGRESGKGGEGDISWSIFWSLAALLECDKVKPDVGTSTSTFEYGNTVSVL